MAVNTLVDEIITQKQASYDNLTQKRLVWDAAEYLLHGQLNDLVSLEASSKVFDPKLSTLLIERAYRVMAQLGTGKVKGISSNDLGDAKLKNLLLDKYVVPNATAQFDFLTKLRLVDLYSNAYGSFDVLIDMDIKPNGYIGPDMWLLNKRDVFKQVGMVGNDADYVIIRTWRPLSYFASLKKENGFTNVSKIVSKLEGLSGSKQNRSPNDRSKREEGQYPQDNPAKGFGYFEVLTRFEKDRWVDVCVDADEAFRDQPNPHDNGELPIETKYSIPLLDDPDGLGDIERGASMQMAMNANWNLYLDGIRLSNQPPVIINKDNVASMSSFQPTPGAMWLGRNNVNNVAQAVNLNPQGIASFNNTYQVANAAIQNLFGTSNTDVPTTVDNSLGKTPQALKMQSARENTRDNADRFYMEQFVTGVMRKMVNLLNKKQTGAVTFRMFPDEIEQLAREYPEIQGMYNDKTGKLTVKKGKSSLLYDYEIVSGSTFAADQKAQQDFLQSLFVLWQQSNLPTGQNILEQKLQDEGYTFHFGELFKRMVAQGGIQDWDKILEEMTPQEKADLVLQKHQAQFQQVLNGMPQGGIQQVPPMPQGQPGMPPQGAAMPPQAVPGGMPAPAPGGMPNGQ